MIIGFSDFICFFTLPFILKYNRKVSLAVCFILCYVCFIIHIFLTVPDECKQSLVVCNSEIELVILNGFLRFFSMLSFIILSVASLEFYPT